MPSSVNYFNDIFSKQILSYSPQKVLDVGCGHGKWGRIVRELIPDCEIHAVEPEKSYLENFPRQNDKGLHDVYDKIFNKDILSFIKEDMIGEERYDIVICGDILEHMFLSEALDVTNFFSYRCGWLIAQFPTHAAQHAVDGITWEVHKSNLDISNFTQYNIQYYIKYKNIQEGVFHHYILMSMDMCDGSVDVMI